MSCSGYLYVHLLELEAERDKLLREKSRLEKEAWIKETIEKINNIVGIKK